MEAGLGYCRSLSEKKQQNNIELKVGGGMFSVLCAWPDAATGSGQAEQGDLSVWRGTIMTEAETRLVPFWLEITYLEVRQSQSWTATEAGCPLDLSGEAHVTHCNLPGLRNETPSLR